MNDVEAAYKKVLEATERVNQAQRELDAARLNEARAVCDCATAHLSSAAAGLRGAS